MIIEMLSWRNCKNCKYACTVPAEDPCRSCMGTNRGLWEPQIIIFQGVKNN